MTNVPIIDAAQSYTGRGWRVFPLSLGSKEPWPRWTGWQTTNHASSPLDVVRVWSGPRENAGVAVVTGALSGIWVLDDDPAHGGTNTLSALVAEHGSLPTTYEVATAGGGRHFYWLMPDDFEVPNSAGKLGPGLDTRGRGGYVVAPPTLIVRDNGETGRYMVASGPGVEPVKAPLWLAELLRPVAATAGPADRRDAGPLPPGRVGQYLAGALPDLTDELVYAVKGHRNDTAHRVAARLWEFVNAGWITAERAASEYQRAATECLRRTEGDGGFGAAATFASGRRTAAGKAATISDEAIGYRPAVELPYDEEPPERRDFSSPGGATGLLPLDDAGRSKTLEFPTDPVDIVGVDAVVSVADQAPDYFESMVQREMDRLRARREAERRLASVEPIDWLGLVIDRDALAEVPYPEPLVAGWLTVNTLARIYGPPGHGKSFTVLDLAMCVCEGIAWHGCAVAPGVVAYVAGEGSPAIRQRVEAWEVRHGRRAGNFKMIARMPAVADGPNWIGFCASMQLLGARLIILDTQAWLMAGLNENDAHDTQTMITACKKLQTATGACVLLVHHTGKDGAAGARGHSSVNGAVETEIEVRRGGTTVTIYSRKQKDGSDRAPLIATLTKVADSAVLVFANDPGTADGLPELVDAGSSSSRDAGQANVRMLIALLRAEAGQGDGLTKTEVRSLWMALPGLGEVPADTRRKRFIRAWSHLEQIDRIGRLTGQKMIFRELDGLDDLDPTPEAGQGAGRRLVAKSEQTATKRRTGQVRGPVPNRDLGGGVSDGLS